MTYFYNHGKLQAKLLLQKIVSSEEVIQEF